MGKVTREDHGDLANAMIRLYSDAKKARDRESMGFRLSEWDQKLLSYAEMFEDRMMDLEINLDIDDQLNLGWKILGDCFSSNEVGLKKKYVDQYGTWTTNNNG